MKATKAILLKQIERLEQEKATLIERPDSLSAEEIRMSHKLRKDLGQIIWHSQPNEQKGILNRIIQTT